MALGMNAGRLPALAQVAAVPHVSILYDIYGFRERDEFVPRFINSSIKDISYGREWVSIPCVNSVDNSYPPFVGERQREIRPDIIYSFFSSFPRAK
jgi:hypothetical protein